RRMAERVEGLRLVESTFKLEWMDDPWADVQSAREWLLRVAADEQPDIVHLNGYALAAAPWSAARVVVAHSCVRSWWAAVLREATPVTFARYKEEVEAGLLAADAVVAPTGAMLESLREQYRARFFGHVISNGLSPAAPLRVRKEPFVLAAGRLWDRAKNVASLAAVAPRLHWPVFLAGETTAPAAPTPAGSPPCEGAHLLGWLEPDSLHGWMTRAAIYALPARYEPFGLSVLEAAQRGCALVLGDIESLREIWGDSALYVPPDDGDALVRAINGLIENPARRAIMVGAARDIAEKLTAERMARGYLELYADLATRGRRTCA
ncbi:MAG: glycosyltransferase family 4 protein, partial [Myxococcota bacterium]|nr:glycosyltransferase family 4 protein [Myxococcota bacterium]